MLHRNTIDDNMNDVLQQVNLKSYLQQFGLVGGTNLSLRFGHRKSIDLDLFSVNLFNPNELDDLLQNDFVYQYRSNNKYMLFCYINGVKTDWVYHSFKLLAPIELIEGVKFFSVADVAAMKLFAVTKRGSKKDFFDIYTLCENIGSKNIVNYFVDKYGADKLWMLKMSLVYFADADEEADPEILSKELTWIKVKNYILQTFAPAI